MKRSADGVSCSGIQRDRLLTCDQVNTNNDSDYDENDLVSDSDDMLSSDEDEDPVQPSGAAMHSLLPELCPGLGQGEQTEYLASLKLVGLIHLTMLGQLLCMILILLAHLDHRTCQQC